MLVATDVAARGIDLDDIGLVVNFDPPEDHDAYTHRVGRTARAGRTGRAVTLVMPEQAEPMARMAVKLGLHEPWGETGYELAPQRASSPLAPPRAGRAAEPPLAPAPGRDGPAHGGQRPGSAPREPGAARLPDPRRCDLSGGGGGG